MGLKILFAARKRSLGQGNIFTSTCKSVHGGGGGRLHPGVSAFKGVLHRGGGASGGLGWADPLLDTIG